MLLRKLATPRVLSLVPHTAPQRSPLWAAALGVLLLSHCDKQPNPSAEATAVSTAPVTSAPAAVASSPAPEEPKPSAEAAAPSASAAKGDCGEEGQPDCPLQAFMKKEVKPAHKQGDFEKLARALEKVAKVAPQGYDEWSEMAMSGVEAAKKKDAEAAKSACKSCHKKYEDKFIEEHRAEELL